MSGLSSPMRWGSFSTAGCQAASPGRALKMTKAWPAEPWGPRAWAKDFHESISTTWAWSRERAAPMAVDDGRAVGLLRIDGQRAPVCETRLPR